jgi:hypothetical protein
MLDDQPMVGGDRRDNISQTVAGEHVLVKVVWYAIRPGSLTFKDNTGAVAGFVTLTLAVPVIPSEPVTCKGIDCTTLTAKPPGGPWAAACREFMIVPMSASTLNTAAAMRWFLNRFIFVLLGQKQ